MASLGTPTIHIQTTTANTTTSFNHEVVSGTDLVVVRVNAVHHASGDSAPSGVTLNGVSLTAASTIKNSVDSAQIWYLPSASVPSPGTYSVVVSWPASGIASAVICVQNGTGFHASPHRDGNTASGNSSSEAASATVDTEAGDIVVDVLKLRGTRSPSIGAGQTQDFGFATGDSGLGTGTYYGSTEEATGSSTEMSWTWSGGSQFVIAAASFAPGEDDEPPGEVTATLGFHTDGTQKVDVSFSPENSTDDYAIMRRPVTDPESDFVLIGVMDATSDDPAVWTDHAIHDMPAGQYEYTVQRITGPGTYGTPYTSDTVDLIITGGGDATVTISAEGGGEVVSGGEVSGFVSDSFTDVDATALTSHTGETGATWTAVGTPTGDAQILSNVLANVCDSGEQILVAASGVPSSADYSVSAEFTSHSDLSHSVGLCVRMDPDDPFGTFIVGRRKQNNNQWQILEYDGGNATVIDAISEAFSGTATVELAVQGTTATLKVGGVVKCSGTVTSTFAGRVGLQIITNSGGSAGTASTGITLDNLNALSTQALEGGADATVTVTATGEGEAKETAEGGASAGVSIVAKGGGLKTSERDVARQVGSTVYSGPGARGIRAGKAVNGVLKKDEDGFWIITDSGTPDGYFVEDEDGFAVVSEEATSSDFKVRKLTGGRYHIY